MKAIDYSQWDSWYYKVYGYFYKRVENKTDVEDLTAETMNTVFMADNIRNFQAYLWRVSHNYLVQYIKYKSTKPITVAINEEIDAGDETPSWIDEEAEHTQSAHYEQKKIDLLKCIEKQLNKIDHSIVQLSIIEEQNSTQISKRLDIKSTTIRQKLARAIKKVKEKCRDIWFISTSHIDI